MTKLLLKNSLTEILQTKSIQNVTIKEICEGADINRSTFYTYYGSQYDLLSDMKQEIFDEMQRQALTLQSGDPQERMLQTLEAHLIYTKENIRTFKAFSAGLGQEDYFLPKRVAEIILTPYIEFLARGRNFPPEIYQRLFIFSTFGFVGIVKNWITTGGAEKPSELAHTIATLVKNTIESYVITD